MKLNEKEKNVIRDIIAWILFGRRLSNTQRNPLHFVPLFLLLFWKCRTIGPSSPYIPRINQIAFSTNLLAEQCTRPTLNRPIIRIVKSSILSLEIGLRIRGIRFSSFFSEFVPLITCMFCCGSVVVIIIVIVYQLWSHESNFRLPNNVKSEWEWTKERNENKNKISYKNQPKMCGVLGKNYVYDDVARYNSSWK